MSTSPIIITPSTSVVLVNTADYAGNPVVLLPNLAGPGALGRIITVRDNDGGSVDPAKSIYLSTTGGALFQSELSSITLSSFRINQPYGFITVTPRLNDGLGNTSYGLMNVYAFPEASPAAYVNTFNTNFGYISTLSTMNLQVNQDTYLKGNLTVNGSITYVSPGTTTLDIGRVNANLISVGTVLNSNFYGVNVGASTINTSTFVVRDTGSVLLLNAGSWGTAAAFGGVVDNNSLTLGNPGTSAGAQIGVSSNFFGLRSFSKSGPSFYSTSVVMRDGTVGVNVGGLGDIGDTNGTSNYSMYVRGALQLSNLGINSNIGMLKTTEVNSSFVEVIRFGTNSSSNYRIDSSSNITEGFFGGGNFTNRYNWLTADKNGSIKFWTGNAGTTERLTIDNVGRVGVGKTPVSPYNLDISGDTRITNTSGTAKLDFSSDTGIGNFSIRRTIGIDGNADILNTGNGVLGFGTNNTSGRMVIDASGRVGINTTSPNAPLMVSKDSSNSINTGAGTKWGENNNPSQLLLTGGFMNTDRRLALGYNTQSDIAAIQSLNYGTGMKDLLINPAGGNVGIGILTTPSYTLDVNGSFNTTTINITYPSDGAITLANNMTIQAKNSAGSYENVFWPRTTDNRTYLNFGTNGFTIRNNSGNETMYMSNNNNIGIGTLTPNYKLDVAGTGHFLGDLLLDGKLQVNNYVGINTPATPAYQLEVNGSGRFAGQFTVNDYVAINTAIDNNYHLKVNGNTYVNGNLTVTGSINLVPTGCIMMYYGDGTSPAPTGWLWCDGTDIPETYTALRNLVGTKTPNMKGRVPVGRDAAQTEFDTLGETGGEKTHTLTKAEMPNHNHGFTAIQDRTWTNDSGVSGMWTANQEKPGTTTATGGPPGATDGQSSPHNNLQPYLVLNYIIKT